MSEPGTARAAVLTAPRRVALELVELAPLDPGSLRVRVSGCGVCGSNLPVWEGRPWFSYPLTPGAPGHEGWGRVFEKGGAVAGAWRVGDPVAFLCESAFMDSVDVPEERVVPLPPTLASTDFPGEALGCGFNVARRAGFQDGQTVAVVGAGFLGAVVTALAVRAGARVMAVSRRDSSLEAAAAMGARDLIRLGDAAAVSRTVDQLTSGKLCDAVVEAVGLQAPLDLAGQLVGFGGRLVVAGFHQDGPRQVDMQLWNWKGIDVINAHERDPGVVLRGIKEAAEASEEWFDPSPLYTHRYPLDELDVALDAMGERRGGFHKALVVR